MKKSFLNLSLIGYLLIALSSTSCYQLIRDDKAEELSDKDDFKFVKVSDKYGMRIPKYMSQSRELNDEASLQYQNMFKETYVIVIDESKEEFIDVMKSIGEYDDSLTIVQNYREIQVGLISDMMNVKEISETQTTKISGMDAESVIIDGTVDGVLYGISYFLTFVESENDMYMIMAWTLSNKKKKYEPTFQTMSSSFKLLN